VNYARAGAVVRCRASAPGSGCAPGCQSPPIKFPAPALMSSVALCAEYNGAELFACAAARRFTGCRAGAQPGRLGTMTARSPAQPPRRGIPELEPWVGCGDTAPGRVGRALALSSSWLRAPGSTRFPRLRWRRCRQKPRLRLRRSKLPFC